MAKVTAVCISAKKGTGKKPVDCVKLVSGSGIEGDAHAGNWHRQVSLLSLEKINGFIEKGADVEYGSFGENIVVDGIDLKSLPVGTELQINGARLEVTQIGKDCHSKCAIYNQVGDCIMPREGIFAKVLSGGEIRPGDEIEVREPAPDRPFTAACITLSDSGAAGKREDRSGPLIKEMLENAGYEVVESFMIPDGKEELSRQLVRLADQRQVNLILTTGGTGFSPRDLTPEATIDVCDRMAPGIAEAVRAYSMTKTPTAMLSRAASGIRGSSLIINLPGSPRAVRECMEFLLDPLEHGLAIMLGRDGNCGRE